MSYAKVSLAKNGAVTPLIWSPDIWAQPIRQDNTPADPFRVAFGQTYNGLPTLPTLFDAQRDIIDPINAEISGAFKLHSVDLTVAAIGLILIIVAASAIAKPL